MKRLCLILDRIIVDLASEKHQRFLKAMTVYRNRKTGSSSDFGAFTPEYDEMLRSGKDAARLRSISEEIATYSPDDLEIRLDL